MTTVSNNSQNNPAYSIDEAVKQSVNVSDATQLENNFLTLMVAQIQNQDPTKPVDSTEFLNQFAAMSQVKSLENMASLSKSNLVLLDNLQTLTAAGLVGQEVKVATQQLELGTDKVKGEINLEHAAGKLALVVTDSNGVKKEIALGSQAPGRVPFELDPKALGLAPETIPLPWHRVLRSNLTLAFAAGSEQALLQRSLLLAEGVIFQGQRVAKTTQWQPDLTELLFVLQY